MAVRHSMRITAAAIALAVGFSGVAQAEPFNIFSQSQAEASSPQLEQVRYEGRRHHHSGINPGAAFALGTMGLIAGAAIASHNERRYCDPDYEYCGRRRVQRRYYDDGYYAPRYYAPRRHYYYD